MSLEPPIAEFPFDIVPEEICGTDERVVISPATSPPYSFIASLAGTTQTNRTFQGTAFEIFLPHVGQRVLVTSGHNTFIHAQGGVPKQIVVTFPGQAPITATGDQLKASPAWISGTGTADPANAPNDYGAILLPGTSAGFGWAILSDDDLDDRLVSISGYNPKDTLKATGGPIEKVTPEEVFYLNDSVPGMSGSAVWTWEGGYWKCVGVHNYGGCPNHGVRFTVPVITQLLDWGGYLWFKKAIGSVAFPGVFLRTDGTEVTSHLANGGGIVNCQFGHLAFETFNILPVNMAPSLSSQPEQETIQFVIRSNAFTSVYLRMNGSGVTEFVVGGGGAVNCQFDPGLFERFNLVPDTGRFNIRSVQFKGVNLRIDGTGVTEGTGGGGGIVNCQFGRGNRNLEILNIVS